MKNIKEFFLGKAKDPLSGTTHRALALTVFFAWVGLGADGISSSCYGPEQAFLALGVHHELALWVSMAIFITVFIIAFAYNRVIVLFPNGGGGYKVATRLLGEYAGLISGISLILDYVLTVVISVSSGLEAIFSIFHFHSELALQSIGALIIIIMTYLNMRGMKESIKVMLPIFVGFIMLHVLLLTYGLVLQFDHLHVVVTEAKVNTGSLWHEMGLIFVIVTFMHAYAQGGATYTGLEAVSNNVNVLAEPRVRTGTWVMFLMALSLGLIAGGILLLYMLWHVEPAVGQTLNAVLFSEIMGNNFYGHILVVITLIFEGGLLFIAANTGFLGGPAVLANMAVDQWLPRSFVNVSDRLVKQNGILLLSIVSLIILFITHGSVSILVVVYSLSVFLAFSLALIGLTIHSLSQKDHGWVRKIVDFVPLFLGSCICVVVLFIVVFTNLWHGSLLGLIFIALMLVICLYIRKSYKISDKLIRKLDRQLTFPVSDTKKVAVAMQSFEPTAVIFVSESVGVAMHTLLAIKRFYGDHFVNVVFVDVRIIDSFSMVGKNKIESLRRKSRKLIEYLEDFCHSKGIPVESYCELTVDYLEKIHEIVGKIGKKYKNSTFFASQLIFPSSNWVQKLIYSRSISSLQYEVYSQGYNMMILPVRVVVDDRIGKKMN